MYAEEVRYVDRWVGELLRGIRARGIYDESLIIITADHGEELFEHGRLGEGRHTYINSQDFPPLGHNPRAADSEELPPPVRPPLSMAHELLRHEGLPLCALAMATAVLFDVRRVGITWQ